MEEHNHNAKKIGWTILLNIVITIAEYIGGIFSGSLALISDAGHNLSDALSLILSYFGERISETKATKKHSFGFKRVEIFTALINSLSLWIVGLFIIYEAVKRINTQENISLGLMLGIAVIGLLGNFFSIMILNKDKDDNLNLKAAYIHLLYDTISSVAVIATAIIIYFTNWTFLDIVASILIAMMIFWSGFKIIKKTIHIFMQGVPEGIDFEDVHKKLLKVKGVLSVHSIHIWSVDSNEAFLSCHVCVGEKQPNTDLIIQSVNKMLEKQFNILHTTIQIERKKICSGGEICCK